MTAPTPQELAEQALSASPADDCIAIVTARSTVNLRWANNTLTTNGITQAHDVTVVSIVDAAGGRRVASLSRSGVGSDDIAALAADSAAAAREAAPAEDAADLVTDRTSTDWAAAPDETSVPGLRPLAEALAAAFDAAAAGGTGRFGYAEHDVATSYLASSRGVRLRHAQPAVRVELTGRSADGTRSAWAGQSTRSPAQVRIDELERDVAQRLQWSNRRVELAAGRYPTVLPPSAVADMFIYAYWSMGGQDAQEGRSVFSSPGGGTRVGEQLTAVPLTLRSDPALPGQECEPWVVARASSRESSVFDNGLPLTSTSWIDNGHLAALLHTRHSAAQAGVAATPVIDNLEMVVGDGAGEAAQLVAGLDRGLLLTCLWYIREVDPQTLLLTGLTRDGVFLVEGGEVVGAVNNFRFNESPVGMLKRVSASSTASDTLAREWGDYFTRTRMPALQVDGFNMSSVSQAS